MLYRLGLMCGALFSVTAAAQAPIHLELVLQTFNPSTHSLSMELRNTSGKVVTGYSFQVQEFDAANTLITDQQFNQDCLYWNPSRDQSSPREAYIIQPGAVRTHDLRVPSATSAKAEVIGVVYADRTWEGMGVTNVFSFRAEMAKSLTRAASQFSSYPATPTAFRSAVQLAREASPGAVSLLLYERLKLPLAVATSKDPLPATIPMPNPQQWQAAGNSLTEEAAFWQAESQPKGGE